MTSSVYRSPNYPTVVAALFFGVAFLAIGAALLLNWQPWLTLGGAITSQINIVPFFGWLNFNFFNDWAVRIAAALIAVYAWSQLSSKVQLRSESTIWLLFFAGILFAVSPAVISRQIEYVIGLGLWGWCQWVQLLPIMIQFLGIKGGDVGGRLNAARAIAYIAEIVACFMQFPPYDGGLTKLLSDWQRLGLPVASRWDWGQFAWAVGTIASVELTLLLMIWLGFQIRLYRVGSRTNA